MKTFKEIKEEIKQVSVSKEHEDTLNGQKDPTSSGLKIKTDATDAQKSNTLKSRKPASALVVKPTNEDAVVVKPTNEAWKLDPSKYINHHNYGVRSFAKQAIREKNKMDKNKDTLHSVKSIDYNHNMNMLKTSLAALKIHEDAAVMSISGGSVSPIAPTDASAVYSLQKDKMKKKILSRKKSVETKKIKWNPGRA